MEAIKIKRKQKNRQQKIKREVISRGKCEHKETIFTVVGKSQPRQKSSQQECICYPWESAN